jgi:general secretion pathway protein M
VCSSDLGTGASTGTSASARTGTRRRAPTRTGARTRTCGTGHEQEGIMNLLRQKPRPEQVWLLLAAAVLIVLAVGVAAFTLNVHAQAAETLAQIEPRHARISGLLQKQDQINRSAKALEASFARYVYPPEGDASQIGNQALQKVRDLAASLDLRVTSSQSQPAKQDSDYSDLDRIAINLRIEGDWSALQGLLAGLTRQTPAIYQNTVQLVAQGGGRFTNPNLPWTVSGQFDLYVLQAHKADADASASTSPAGAASSPSPSGAAVKRREAL